MTTHLYNLTLETLRSLSRYHFNPFEPDNQSPLYRRIEALIAQLEAQPEPEAPPQPAIPPVITPLPSEEVDAWKRHWATVVALNSPGPTPENIITLLRLLPSDEQRTDVFREFCTTCGRTDPKCACWNDE